VTLDADTVDLNPDELVTGSWEVLAGNGLGSRISLFQDVRYEKVKYYT